MAKGQRPCELRQRRMGSKPHTAARGSRRARLHASASIPLEYHAYLLLVLVRLRPPAAVCPRPLRSSTFRITTETTNRTQALICRRARHQALRKAGPRRIACGSERCQSIWLGL
eukprot:3437979-Pleurochrysis_carterae.AAC.4